MLGLIVNDEVFFVAKLFDVAPQDANAQRVKCADCRLLRDAVLVDQLGFWNEFADAFLHFASSFVGKGDSENVSGASALGDHVGYPAGDDACLARAGPGEDQHRPIHRLYGLSLLGVQRRKLHRLGHSVGQAIRQIAPPWRTFSPRAELAIVLPLLRPACHSCNDWRSSGSGNSSRSSSRNPCPRNRGR